MLGCFSVAFSLQQHGQHSGGESRRSGAQPCRGRLGTPAARPAGHTGSQAGWSHFPTSFIQVQSQSFPVPVFPSPTGPRPPAPGPRPPAPGPRPPAPGPPAPRLTGAARPAGQASLSQSESHVSDPHSVPVFPSLLHGPREDLVQAAFLKAVPPILLACWPALMRRDP
jgi:hypothetical protein